MSIFFKQKGDWDKTTKSLMNMKERRFYSKLIKYGEKGVKALMEATPKDTGLTAFSWDYEIQWTKGSFQINWTNSNLADAGTPIALLIQYGHGTKNGGWVLGRDYINPALTPIFDKIANEAWKEVTK